MSSGQETPKTDTYENGAPRAADPKASLTDKERATLTKILANPLDFPAEFPGWLDDFVRLRLTAKNIAGLGGYTGYTGELLVVLADYTAETGVLTIEAKGGTWMYLNGATFDATTYSTLNTYLGTNTLPDTRGRSLWLTGTNAALDLFDNDGVTESSRQPKHTHSDTLDVSGAPGGTFITSLGTISRGSAGADVYNSSSTGSPTAGTLGISGSVGSGMSGSDAVAHIAIGSAFVHV